MCGNSTSSKDVVQPFDLSQGFDALKVWTGKTNATIVYDSSSCEWDHNKFNELLKTPSNAVIGITEDGDVFGGFVSVAIEKANHWLPDGSLFVFSLFCHWRCDVPQKWELLERRKNVTETVMIFDTTNSSFIRFGSFGFFFFGEGRNCSYIGRLDMCFEGSNSFAITGREDARFTTNRLLIIHLE